MVKRTGTGNCKWMFTLLGLGLGLPASMLAGTITGQPGSVEVAEGSSASFSVQVESDEAVGYQWQYSTDGGNLFEDLTESPIFQGVGTSALLIDPVGFYLNESVYRVRVSGDSWEATSNTATLTVLEWVSPIFEQQPQLLFPGDGVHVTANVQGVPEPALQWQRSQDGGASWEDLVEGDPYSGVTTADLVLDPMVADVEGDWLRLVATNSSGTAISDAVVMEMAPVVQMDPVDFAVFEGRDGQVGAEVSGFPLLELQWQFSVDGLNFFPLSDGEEYSGVTTAALQLLEVDESQTGYYYRLRAENDLGVVTTGKARLDVRQPRTYADWVAEKELAAGEDAPDWQAGPLQLSNLEAYAFGVDRMTAVPEDLPRVRQATGGESLTVRYQRHVDATDVSMVLQGSADLEEWRALSPETDRAVAYAQGVETREAELDWSGGEPMFVRMKTRLVPEGFSLIPMRSFAMGDGHGDGFSDEVPVHEVFMSAFYMGTREVTKAQWDEIRLWAEQSGLGYEDLPAGSGKGADHPVQNVSWFDVVKWLNAWSEKDGLAPVYTVDGLVMRTGTDVPEINYAAAGYRLPSEAEWEIAARGGVAGKRFPWGDRISHAEANYFASDSYSYDESPTNGYHPNFGGGSEPYTAPVGSFAANGYGLFDTVGNVWEWCNDWYDSSYYDSSPAGDPTGPASGSERVSRGGGWTSTALYARTSVREAYAPNSRHHFMGFRAARSIAP